MTSAKAIREAVRRSTGEGDAGRWRVGALIGAYQEDDSGGSARACFRSPAVRLLEYQVRCAAAAGAAPIVVVVERVPQALQDAFERLRSDGIGVFPVSDVGEALSRFEAGSMILLIGDGIAPPVELGLRTRPKSRTDSRHRSR